jgi:hypothetical protein
MQDIGYQEFNDYDVLLDREDGLLPGLTMEFGQQWQSLTASLRFEVIDGVAYYDGQTQGGSPLKTRSDERIVMLSALLRYPLQLLPEFRPTFIAGLGYREWRRSIRATSTSTSLYEVYRWPYWTLGAAANLWRQNAWSFGIEAYWLRPWRPAMVVTPLGYDRVRLDLGARSSARIGLPISWNSASQQRRTVTLYWQSWRLARSADKTLTSGGVITTGTAYEPRSVTNMFGISLTLQLKP